MSNWDKINQVKQAIVKKADYLKKTAFINMAGGQKVAQEAPGGMPMDPAAAGAMPPGAPMDPAAAGMPPEAMGDPAAAGAMPPGAPMDPAAAGIPPEMMGAGAPLGVDPATAGMIPMDAASAAGGAVAGAAPEGPSADPTITLTLSQLWDVVTKMLGLAKKIGANGQSISPEAAPAPAQSSQDAIKAAVIEALGDMGLNQVKAAEVQKDTIDSTQRMADEADLESKFKTSREAVRNGGGRTVHFTPDEIRAGQAFAEKYGQKGYEEALRKIMQVKAAQALAKYARAAGMSKKAQNGITREGPTVTRANFDKGFNDAISRGAIRQGEGMLGTGYLSLPAHGSQRINDYLGDKTLEGAIDRLPYAMPSDRVSQIAENGIAAAQENASSLPEGMVSARGQRMLDRAGNAFNSYRNERQRTISGIMNHYLRTKPAGIKDALTSWRNGLPKQQKSNNWFSRQPAASISTK